MTENRVVDLTSELVRIPSVLGRESSVADKVATEMESSGYDTVETDPLGNIIGIIRGDGSGPTVLLDAHMDTVDIHPESAWSRGPFSGEVFEGKIYGRGATDMKGALAAMVCAGGNLDGVERSSFLK